jgi:curved DNA-binding protein
VLGVSKTASQDEIRRAYKALARKYHPDKNPGDAQAESRFKEATAAYELIDDPDKRKLFDEFGHAAASPGFDPERARAQRARPGGFGGGGFGGGGFGGAGGGPEVDFDLSDLFGGFARGGGGFRGFGGRDGFRVPRKGADVTTELSVGFLEAMRGVERSFTITMPQQGPVSTKLNVPPGVEDGQKLRLKGRGMPGSDGGPSGDLFVTVRVQDHPVFSREGLDVHLDLPVTVKEAILGAEVSVPTLEGPVKLKVPPGAQSGQTLRLRGKGGRDARGKVGDLLVHVSIRVPELPAGEAALEALDLLEQSYAADVRQKLA